MTVTNSGQSSPKYDVIALERLGNIAFDKRNWSEATRLLSESLTIREKSAGTKEPGYGLALDRLAEIHMQQGKYQEALVLLEKALPILESAFYPGHSSVAAIVEHQGDCFVILGRLAEAEAAFKRASDIFTTCVTLENRVTLRSLYKLAKVYIAEEKAAEAKATLQKGLKYVDTPLGPMAEFRYQLALAAILLKEAGEARDLLHTAAADFKQRGNYGRVADCSSALADICRLDNAELEADEWMRQSALFSQMAVNAPYPDDIFLATLLRA
ncbi:hypothetical protein BH11CYA1_BH11CYA1_09900 [soil metagenome]